MTFQRKRSGPDRGPRLWLALASLLAIGAVAGRLLPHDTLDWQRSVVLSEPWRLWTAAWVHWSALHLLANLAGCLLVAASEARQQVRRQLGEARDMK